ncbi:MAG: putative LPS assembly protein LptD [Candidatus Omnitrophota bacterium]|nr:putative LPS assembly protein LptD [Candidatus Omnitrophota bacterium]
MSRIIIIFATLIILFPSSGVSVVDEDKSKFPSFSPVSKDSKEPVVINGDTVEYSETGKTASATDNVVITYQDMKLTCRQAVFHIDTKEVYAEGDVFLTQGQNYFKGDRMVYNMDTKTGTVLNSSVFIEPWFYGGGEKAEKVSVNDYFIKRGHVTTCDKPQPHYRVQSKRLKVYLGDKVTANDILLFVDKVPIFYFPYYSHSLKDEHPGVTIIPGRAKNWGYFLLTSWRYYFNDDFRGRVLIDYREKRDFAYGVNLNYRIPDMGDGILRTYFITERKSEGWTWSLQDQPKKGGQQNRWRAALRHRWEMDPLTLGTFEYNKMSDANVIKDYFMRDWQRDMVANTYASIIRTDENYTTSALVQKRVNRFDSTVEYLPKLDFTTRSLKIGPTNFYYEGDGSFASLAKKFPMPSDLNYFAKRVDTKNQLQYQANLLGWLSLTPFVGTQQTWYNEDLERESNTIRGSFFTGIGMNTRFYRVYDIKSNLFDMEINKLRHIISPTVSYSYKHRPTVSRDKLKQFDGIDTIGFVNAISPSIENKLQTKREIGGKLQAVDLARFIVGTNYDFGFEEKKGGRLSNYNLSFEATPYNWMRMLANSTYNPHVARFESFSFNIVGDPYGAIGTTGLSETVYTDIEKEKWSYGGSYRWNNNVNSQLEGELMFNITPKWKFTTYQRFDIKAFASGKKLINKPGEQEYRLSRDLHCWIGELVYNVSRNSGHTIWVMFRLKAFPDMPLEFERRYYPPNFGTLLPQTIQRRIQ